jgi:hypothetical protein
MDVETVLFHKDGLKFIKLNNNNYTIQFTMENTNIILSKVIDFSLISLIYELNQDIYEKVNIEKLYENEVNSTFLIKHFFEDIGLPQCFVFLNIQKRETENKIIFETKSIETHRPNNMPNEAELLNIKDMTINCEIITPHKILFHFNIVFDSNVIVPTFAEKMSGIIISKIFKRVKQFIENVRI